VRLFKRTMLVAYELSLDTLRYVLYKIEIKLRREEDEKSL